MNKIKINGLEIEFGNGIEISAEGDKIVIRKAGEKVENHIHYHSAPAPTPTWPIQPFWQIPPVMPIPYWHPPIEITCGDYVPSTVTTIARQ